ncbi:MAG: TonB-dependent copper receptor [Vicinamibacterales bacterium]
MSRLVGTLVLLFLCTAGYAFAQPASGPAQMSGTVSDSTGGVLRGARVEARAVDGVLVRQTTTDEAGRYTFENLPAGRYAVSAMLSGFEPAAQLAVAAPLTSMTVDLVLGLARSEVRVEVTAHATDRPLAVETDPQQPRQPIPAQDGADYLKTIPGFSVIRKGGTDGDPVLRGMAGSRLGILLDGQNLLGGCSFRMDPPTAYVFPDAYDSITVLKGPQSVAHGPGNSAGVVLFEREHAPAPGVSVYAAPTFGSFGRNDQATNLRVAGREAYIRAGVTRSAMGDYRDGDGNSVHSEYQRWSADTAVGWTPDPDTVVEASSTFSDGRAAYADRMMDGAQFARQNLGVRFERRNVSPRIAKIEAQTYYNYVDHVMDNYSLRPFTPSMMMRAPTVSNPDRRTLGGRAAIDMAWGGATMATAGLDWQNNRHAVRNSSNQDLDPFEAKDRIQDAAFNDVGIFGEMTRAIGARQRVIGGLRFDRWSARDDRVLVNLGMMGTAPNPTAGLERHETLPSGFGRYERELGAGTTVYAGLGHTQRTPDYWELVSQQGTTSLSAFDARPEKTTQFDTGVMYRTRVLSGSVSMFANRIDDFLLIQSNFARPAAETGMSTSGMSMGMAATAMAMTTATVTRNVDASTWGGEATLVASLTERLKLDTSLSYVRGDNRTDNRPLAQLPPLESRLGLQYSTERWSLGGLTRLVGAQNRFALNQGNIVGQDLGPTPAFGVFSLNGSTRVHRLASLSMGIDNLFDRTYAEFVSRGGADVTGFPTTTRVNEPGRTMWVKLDFRY